MVAGVAVYSSIRSGRLSSGAESSSTSRPPSTSVSSTVRVTPSVLRAVAVPSVETTLPLTSAPNYVAASPDGQQLYIADGTNTVSVIDTVNNHVTTDNIRVPGPARFLSFSPDGGYAYVSLWDKEGGAVHAVVILDTTDNTIKKTITVDTRPFLAAVTPDGRWLYVPDHDTHAVTVIDTRSMNRVGRIAVAPNPHYVSFSVDGKRAYVANHESNVISVIDTSLREVVKKIGVGLYPHSVEPNPRKPMVINVNWGARSVCVIDTSTNTVRKTIQQVGDKPLAVHWSADGRYAYVVNNGSNDLSVIDANTLKVSARLQTGKAPTAIAVLPDGSKGYVSNSKDNSLTVVRLAR
jgi:YVTN family beta-propeller protein